MRDRSRRGCDVRKQGRKLVSGAFAALALLLAPAASGAATITYTLTGITISTFQVCADVGGNGRCEASSLSASATPFAQSVQENALDTNTTTGELATAGGLASQSTFVTPVGVLSNSLSETVTQLFQPSGFARAEAFSELKITFFSDVDLAFSLDGSVDCAGGCTSFIQLYGPNNELLFDATTASGGQSGSLRATLLANQSYFLWARVDLVSFPQPLYDTATGTWDIRLDLSGAGGGVPEPTTSALLAGGALAVRRLARRRATRER